MALRSVVHKVELAVADVDRGIYADYTLTLAQHPSETVERMMVRLLAFVLLADDGLKFGRGLSAEDEADLWCHDATGVIALWVEIGCPDVRAVRKASGRARHVVVVATGERRTEVWWKDSGIEFARLPNLSVCAIDDVAIAALAERAARSMRLAATIQDGHALLAFEGGVVDVTPRWLLARRG